MALFVVLLAGVACRPSGVQRGADAGVDARSVDARLRDARSGPAARDPNALGQAGPVILDVDGFRVAVVEARILESWRRGEQPPLEALRDARLRRRLMSQALETRVVRREVERRGLAPPPERFAEMLRLAAAGHRLEQPPGPEVVAAAPALPEVEPALEARFGAPAAQVRRVGLDVLEADLLTDALLAEVSDERLRADWLARNTRIVLDIVRIPRVPTSAEIDRAIAERGPAIAAWFEKNQRLFRVAERAFVRRLLVPVPADATPAVREAARQRAEALRVRAEAAGRDGFEAFVRQHAPPREARRGGRMTVGRTQLPAAFEVDPKLFAAGPGPLSPVMACAEGWHVFRVEGRAPAVERALEDTRVQREIASELLREADALPDAKRIAGRVRQLMAQSPDGAALAALVEEKHLRRATTEPFAAAGAKVVPQVGLAPTLFDAAFAATVDAPITAVLPVRQHYVVARLVSREAPDPATWPEQRARFTTEWKARRRPRVVDAWLSQRLEGRAMWIDSGRLKALTMAELGVEVPGGGAERPADGGPTRDAGR